MLPDTPDAWVPTAIACGGTVTGQTFFSEHANRAFDPVRDGCNIGPPCATVAFHRSVLHVASASMVILDGKDQLDDGTSDLGGLLLLLS